MYPASDFSGFAPDIFTALSDAEFSGIALSLFQFQYEHNPVYRRYCELLSVNPDHVDDLHTIPFLPISFFKTEKITTTPFEPGIVFTSSGTTGANTSSHYLKEVTLYEKSFTKGFTYFYGNPGEYVFLALLPAYLERTGSSLIYMVDALMKQSGSPENGFYLNNYKALHDKLIYLKESGKKTILFGVSFALLDFIEQYPLSFPELIVFETGGMKGRRKEMVKEELHELLEKGFGIQNVHSEYGMTELLSQAYSNGNNVFRTSPWMKIMLRSEKDPLSVSATLKSGAINVIDLANIYSCAFIATDDIGKMHPDGSFEILGRLDNAQIRGCNLLVI